MDLVSFAVILCTMPKIRCLQVSSSAQVCGRTSDNNRATWLYMYLLYTYFVVSSSALRQIICILPHLFQRQPSLSSYGTNLARGDTSSAQNRETTTTRLISSGTCQNYSKLSSLSRLAQHVIQGVTTFFWWGVRMHLLYLPTRILSCSLDLQ